MKKEEFDTKVTTYLTRATERLDAETTRRLAQFYSDREILTVIYCSSCEFDGTPDEEELLADGSLSDKCPECGATGYMHSYTAEQWLDLEEAWANQ